MSDSLQDWTTYYQQLAEASRFAAAVQAQPSLEASWNGAVASAFAGGTVTHALDTLDSWITSAGYDTLSHMALDAVMPATPQPGDIYGPWRKRLSEIAVTNGTQTFLESMTDDADLEAAFEDQFIQYAITRLNSTPASTDDDSTSDSSVAASPDTELTYVTMLDARGTENIDAWIASQAVNVSPPPNIAQVTRDLLDQAGAQLSQWVGDYGKATTQLVRYDNSTGAAVSPAEGVGPRIVVSGDDSSLQIFLDGTQLQNVQWSAGPQATWQRGGGNTVGGTANFGCVFDAKQGTITNDRICGNFIVPSSVGNQYGGLSLTWPQGATSATISFQATKGASDSDHSNAIIGSVFFVFIGSILCCTLSRSCRSTALQCLQSWRSRRSADVVPVDAHNQNEAENQDADDSHTQMVRETGAKAQTVNIELSNEINPNTNPNAQRDLEDITAQTNATVNQAGTNLQQGATTNVQRDAERGEETRTDSQHPGRGTTAVRPGEG